MTQIAATPSPKETLRGAIIGGAINAAINGGLQLYMLRDQDAIPLSVDGITNDEVTVFGTAVPLALSIALILTVVAYATLKAPKRKFVPTVLWLAIKQGLATFGLCVAAAVVWQRSMGTISVSLLTAVIILGIIAGVVGGMINYMTIRASLLPSE